MSKEQVRIGVVGVGARGTSLVKYLLDMPDVRITAICDIYQDRVEAQCRLVKEKCGHRPGAFSEYTQLLGRTDVDAVVIPAPMVVHAKMTMAFLRSGKAVAVEVGGAASLDECWDMVRASEESGSPCMMLENCCYGRKEMAILNMVRKGLFGELVYCRGGYQHDLRQLLVEQNEKNRHTRIHNYVSRNGDIYPTHGLGPAAKLLGVNRGNRMVSLTSMATKARGLSAWVKEHRDAAHPFANTRFAQGDVVSTIITCAGGEQIVLTHDTTLPRPYFRGGYVQGTGAVWTEASLYPTGAAPYEEFKNGMIYLGEKSPLACDRSAYRELWQSFDDVLPEYEHPLWKAYLAERGADGEAIGAGMDRLVLAAFVDSVKNGTRPPVDVYDAAAWMAVTCLSEESIAAGGAPVAVPDFTGAAWLEPAEPTPSRYSLDRVDETLFA